MEWNAANNSTSHIKRYELGEVLQRPKVALIFSFLVLLNLLTLLGNGMVIWTVFRTRRLHFSAFYFVANLAVADFLVGLVVLPISLAYHVTFEMEGRWVFGSVACKFWLLANFWFCSSSVLSLCLISWDRYVAVTSPLYYKSRMSKMKVKRMIVLIWTFSFSLAIILITKAHLMAGSKTNCTIHGLNDPIFTIIVCGFIFLIPVAFLVFVNSKVWFVARRHKKRIQTLWEDSQRLGNSSINDTTSVSWRRIGTSLTDLRHSNEGIGRRASLNEIATSSSSRSGTGMSLHTITLSSPKISSPKNSFTLNDVTHLSQGGTETSWFDRSKWSLSRTIKQEIRTFRTFLVVIGVFIVCWCPFFAFVVLDNFEKINPFLFYVTIVVAYSNSAMNTFIYGLLSQDFRKAMTEAVFCCYKR